MPAFTPAITSSNCLEVVRLNRSISIFVVISNLFKHSRTVHELHNSISPALLRPFSTVLFSAADNAVLVEGEGDRVARKVRSVWWSSQFAVQKFARPTVGNVSRRGVVVFSVMAGEGVTLTRIAVDRRVRFLSKCRFNRRLCSLGNELILLGQMHEKGRMKPVDLSQIFLSIGAVIPDRRVDAVVAHGCHEDHQRAEAIAEQGDLTVTFRETAYCVDGVLDVFYAGISVISLIEAKAVVPVGLGGDVQVDARFLPPVQVWSDREVALFRQFITVLANVGVHTKQFLQNNNSGSRQGLRSCDIGEECAA